MEPSRGSQSEGATTAAPSPPPGISPAFWGLLVSEPLADQTVLDVGTGSGRLALALSARCRRVVGIDHDRTSIEEARRRASAAGIVNADFAVVDADQAEYAVFEPDLVVAHLCMSDAIAERASRVLRPDHAFAFVAFHTDQWRETGKRSRFAYDEERVRRLLGGCGFTVQHLEVERDVKEFASVEEGLAAAVGLADKWKTDGRWFRYIRFLEEGGRTLTRSHLIVKARRT